MTRAELRRLARLGAEARLRELEQEIAAIHAAFPDLRTPRASNPQRAAVLRAVAGVPAAVAGAVTRRRPRLSREARKRIAEAQRRRWAEWKAKNEKAAVESPAPKERPAVARPSKSPKKK